MHYDNDYINLEFLINKMHLSSLFLLSTVRFIHSARGAGVFFTRGGQNLKKGIFLLKRHCQQKQISVVMLQFEILVDMIEFQFAQDRPVFRKSFILLICCFGSINFRPMPTLFNKPRVQNLNLKVCCILQKPLS